MAAPKQSVVAPSFLAILAFKVLIGVGHAMSSNAGDQVPTGRSTLGQTAALG